MMISGSLHQKHDTKWSEKNNIQHQNHVSNLSSYINVRSSRGIGIFTLLLRTKRFRCTCLCRPSKLAPDCFELLGTRIGRQLQRTEHLAFCLSFCLFFCGQTTPSSGCKKPNQGTSRVNVVWFSEKFGELRLKAFSYVIIILWYPMISYDVCFFFWRMHLISGIIPTFDTQHQYHQIQKVSKPSNHPPNKYTSASETKHESSMPWTIAMVGCHICLVSHARWDAKQTTNSHDIEFSVCVWLVYLTFQYPARNSISKIIYDF